MDTGFCTEAVAAVPPPSLHSRMFLRKTVGRPLGASLSTRVLPLSTIKTAPSEATVRPLGLERPARVVTTAPVPSAVKMVPSGCTQRRAWFRESTIKVKNPAPAAYSPPAEARAGDAENPATARGVLSCAASPGPPSPV